MGMHVMFPKFLHAVARNAGMGEFRFIILKKNDFFILSV